MKHYGRWRRFGDPLKVLIGPEAVQGRCIRCRGKGPFTHRKRVCDVCYRAKETAMRARIQAAHPGRSNEWGRARHQRNKEAVLLAYGGKCACCGESHPAFLALDHKNGGGNKHRRHLGNGQVGRGGSKMYAWAIRNNFPKWMQLLCHNCSFAKSHYPGGCPHKQGATCPAVSS